MLKRMINGFTALVSLLFGSLKQIFRLLKQNQINCKFIQFNFYVGQKYYIVQRVFKEVVRDNPIMAQFCYNCYFS